MKYQNAKKIKEKFGVAPKVKEIRKTGEFCARCGCQLTNGNRSFDSRLCKVCFDVEVAEVSSEDMYEDSLTDSERLAKFLGCFVSMFSIDEWFKSGLDSILMFFRLLDCSSCRDFMSCFKIEFAGNGFSFEWDLHQTSNNPKAK